MNKLKTVKHFKDLGLDFVKGDACNDGECDYNGDWHRTSKLFHYDKVTCVAWREYTVFKPEFKGDIQWCNAIGEIYTTTIGGLHWDACVVKWRPLLNNEPEVKAEPVQVKPVYTQAMADAGELPSVGMKVVARYNHDSKSVTHCGYVLYVSEYRLILDINGSEWHGLLGDYVIEPIDTRTDKEKADDLFKFYLKGENVSTHKSFSQAVIDGDFGDNVTWSKS